MIRCREPIRTSYFYKVGLSRQTDGTVSLSLNGYLIFFFFLSLEMTDREVYEP